MIIRLGKPEEIQVELEKHVHGELLVEFASCAPSVQADNRGTSRGITSPGTTGTGLTSHHDLLSAMKGVPAHSDNSHELTRSLFRPSDRPEVALRVPRNVREKDFLCKSSGSSLIPNPGSSTRRSFHLLGLLSALTLDETLSV